MKPTRTRHAMKPTTSARIASVGRIPPRHKMLARQHPLASSPTAGHSCECVAYITRRVEHGCRLGRLHTLVQTAGPRTVYVLHDHNHTPDASAVNALRPRERLRLVPQPLVVPSSPWGLFGGKMIGYSKASFVLWMLQNGSTCTQTWQIEDDTFFTGPWNILFDAHTTYDSDLVAVTLPSDPSWPHDANCFVHRNQTHTDAGIRCRQEGRLPIVVWPLLRMSQRLAAELSRVLTDEGAKGFHEALVAPVCERAAWCHISPLSIAHVGRLVHL